MQIVVTGVPFCVNYTSFDQSPSLYVAATIYNVTTGTPVLMYLQPMVDVGFGCYSANFTPSLGQTYLVISAIYLDSGYTEPDPNRSPASETYTTLQLNMNLLAFSFPVYNQLSTLNIAGNVYDMASGSPVFKAQIPMVYVTLGTYFGAYTGALSDTYQIVQPVYTDDTYTTVNTFYAPNAESFLVIQASNFTSTINVFQNLSLTAQSTKASLTGQRLSATLVAMKAS